MKKLIFIILFSIPFIASASFWDNLFGTNSPLLGAATSTIVQNIVIKDLSSGVGQCLKINDSTGLVKTTTCGSGGGGLTSSTPFSAGYIPFATTTNSLTNSNIFQSGQNIGIGTIQPTGRLEVQGGSLIVGGTATSTITGDGFDSFIGSNLYVGHTEDKSLVFGDAGNYGVSVGAHADGSYGFNLLGLNATDTVAFNNNNGWQAILHSDFLSTNRSYLFPDISGSFILGTSTIGSLAKWTALNTLQSASAGTDYVAAITAGTNITISSSSGVVTINATGGTGLTSLNGSTSSTQTFATGTDTNLQLTIGTLNGVHTFSPVWAGTLADSRITSAATWNAKITTSSLSIAYSPLAFNQVTGVFSLPTSTASQSGFLSSADWGTFNGKQNSITLATSGASNIRIASSSATWTFSQPTSTASISGYLSSADWLTFSSKITTSSLSVSGAPLTYNNVTGVIGLSQTLVSSTYTGSVDFGGATSFEIPNGASPTLNVIGQIALDTTDNQLLVATSTGGGGVYARIPKLLWATTIASSSAQYASSSNLMVPVDKDGTTVLFVMCYTDTGTTTIALTDSATAAGNPTNQFNCAPGTNTTQNNLTVNNTWTAGEIRSIRFSSSSAARPNFLSISAYGNITAE